MPNPNPKPFKKTGAAANPNGRPKREWTVKGLIEEALEEEDVDGVPFKKKVTQKLRQLALRGDMAAIKEIHQRLDGMPNQTTDIHVKELPTPIYGSKSTKEDV